MGDTVGFLADGDTLGTVIHLTCLIRAHDLAVGLLTLHITYGVLWFLAGGMALGWLTDGRADGITLGIVTLP